MIVTRIENGIPYVQLNLGERNFNNEIRNLLPQPVIVTKIKPEIFVYFFPLKFSQ